MPAEQALTPRQAERDAVLTCAVAAVSTVAFLAFVALPIHADALETPAAVDGPSPLGFLIGALFAPVAAGLAAFVSGAALRARRPTLTPRARRLHWSTIVLSTALLVAYASDSSALRTWLD
ncbi:hypothetical protein [Humibacillus xanthopallidus]|nr:hypothetical protein [Humibacillus xanthopallidus]